MKIGIENGKLVIEMDLSEAAIAEAGPSKSGLSKLLSRGGAMPIGVVNGHKISVGLMVSATPLKQKLAA